MTAGTCRQRRGSVYVLVLLTALLVTVLGLAAVSVQASVRNRAEDSAAGARATVLARGGLELAAEMIRSEGKSWRSKLKDGDWATELPVGTSDGDGVLTITAVDPVDGKINDKKDDPVEVTATVTVGDAVRSVRMRMADQLLPSRALAAAVTARGDVSASGGATIGVTSFSGQTAIVAARGTISASSGTVQGEAESPSGFSGSNFPGGTRATAWARDVPDWDEVYDAYEDEAEDIGASDLPNLLGLTYYIDKVALGPGRNPFGSKKTQGEGLYRIDMSGKSLVITNSRIVGTLIVRNAASVTVASNVSWQPAVAGYPALLVEGNVLLSHSSGNLSESAANENFNPSGVPASGGTDSDKSDTYPSRIDGLVYSSADITGGNSNATVRGPVIARGDVRVLLLGGLNVQFDDASWANPPPGFRRRVFGPTRGSYERVVDE